MAQDAFEREGFELVSPDTNTFEGSGFIPVDLNSNATSQGFEQSGFAPGTQVGGDQQGVSFGEMAGAAVESGGRGVMTSGGLVTGAIAGAKTGAAVAPFTGPLAPIMPFVGGAVGAVGGALMGSGASEMMGLRDPSQMPPELRSSAYFGESLFGASPMIAAPYSLAGMGFKAGESYVGKLINQIIDTAKTYPFRFGAAEISAAASAATAAGFAEEIAPGRAEVRIPSEVVAGVLNPTRLAVSSIDFAMKTGQRVLQSISPAARETASAQLLNEMFTRAGEDPTILARMLREQTLTIDGKEVPLTAAQLTGSPTLAALEQNLTKINPRFGAESSEKAKDALDILRGQIVLLRGTGDPQALTEAARLQGIYFKTLIQGRVDEAINNATDAAGKITKDTPAARAEINVKARELINQSITQARKAESELWDSVDKTRSVGVDSLSAAYQDVIGDLLPELVGEKTPTVVQKFLNRVTSVPKGEESLIILPENVASSKATGVVGTNVKEMTQLRSELLDMARQATDKGDYGQARIFNNLAEAVLDDLDKAFVSAGDSTYDSARQFSRELNDTFTRSFVGKVTATGRYGNRVMPEMTLNKALATGKEAGAIQLQELEESTRFMVNRGFGDPDSVQQMMSAQERIIRLAAADTIDPKTGMINPTQVTKFLKDNELLMNRFPEIRDDLTAALTSNTERIRVENLAKNQVNIMEKQKAFTNLARVGNATAADRILVSRNQETDLKRLIDVAKVGGKTMDGMAVSSADAIEGLRVSMFDAALRKSTRNGVLDIDSFRQFMFEPSTPGAKSPIQIMQENGVVDQKQVDNMRAIFDMSSRIRESTTVTTSVDMTPDVQDAVASLFARLAGSAIAGAGGRAVGSTAPSLIVHGAAARFMENVVSRLPVKARQQILIEAMNDPKKAALLLDKVEGPAQSSIKARQINAWLIQSGIVTAKELTEPDERDPMTPSLLRQPR